MGNGSSVKEIRIYKAELKDVENNIKEVDEFIEKSSTTYSVTEYPSQCEQLVNKTIDTMKTINEYAAELYESIIILRKRLEELLQNMQRHITKLLEERADEPNVKQEKQKTKSTGLSDTSTRIGGFLDSFANTGGTGAHNENNKQNKDVQRQAEKQRNVIKAATLENILKTENASLQNQNVQAIIEKTADLLRAIKDKSEINESDKAELQKLLKEWIRNTKNFEEQKEQKTDDSSIESKENHNKNDEERPYTEKKENPNKDKEKEKEVEDRRKREEEERQKKEEEIRRKKEDEEKRIKEEEDRRRKAEEDRRKREEEERQKKEEEIRKKEEEEKRIKEKEDRLRKAEEYRRKREEEERQKKEEERRKKEEEERRIKEEEDRRRKAEEDRRKREEEEREKKEEERRKKEEERQKKRRQEEEERQKRRRNPVFWQPFIYEIVDNTQLKTEHNDGVCCVAFAIPDSIEKDDLCCSCSDHSAYNIRDCISDDEQIASLVTNIKSVSGKELSLECPLRVYIPHHIITENNRTISVKVSVNDGNWNRIKTLKPYKQEEKQDLQFVGFEVNNFSYLKVFAVTIIKPEKVKVPEEGILYKCIGDKDVSIMFPESTFKETMEITLTANNIPKYDIPSAKANHAILSDVFESTSVISFDSGTATDKPFNLIVKGLRHKGNYDKFNAIFKEKGREWKFADCEINDNVAKRCFTYPVHWSDFTQKYTNRTSV